MARQFHSTVTTEPAHNRQFGKMAGVARMTPCAEQCHLALVQTVVIPATSPSCYPVGCKFTACLADNQQLNLNILQFLQFGIFTKLQFF